MTDDSPFVERPDPRVMVRKLEATMFREIRERQNQRWENRD